MAKLLIINADDLGYDPAVTRGLIEAMERGLVCSATLMVNGPDSESAASLARGRAIGLHLNLARWKPLWRGFPPELLEGGELAEARAGALPEEVVEAEVLAQLGRLEELLGAPPTHVDVHKHLHQRPAILGGLLKAAAKRRLPVRAISETMRAAARQAGVKTPDAFIGDAGAEPYWTLPRLRQALESLPEGLTELMCHPGYAPTSLTSGYAHQRETELETFTHDGARKLIGRLGVRLVDFTALAGG